MPGAVADALQRPVCLNQELTMILLSVASYCMEWAISSPKEIQVVLVVTFCNDKISQCFHLL